MMRIVATSDTHFPFSADKIPDGDLFIHAGDLMYSGYPDEYAARVKSLADLPHKSKMLVAGNHDMHMMIYPGPALADMRKAGVHVIGPPSKYDCTKLVNGLTVLGLPYVQNLPTWAFNKTDEWMEDFLLNKLERRFDIIVSHAPPAGILDSGYDGGHYGFKAYRKYLDRFQPKIWICGHVHERYGHIKVEGCDFYNVSMCNIDYNQVNKPFVIEI